MNFTFIQFGDQNEGWIQEYLADPEIWLHYFQDNSEPKPDTNLNKGFIWVGDRILVPQSKTLEIIALFHSSRLVGHFGLTKTIDLINRKYTFPELKEQVKNFIQACDICQRMKPERLKQKGRLRQLEILGRLWSCISLDWLELPLSSGTGWF